MNIPTNIMDEKGTSMADIGKGSDKSKCPEPTTEIMIDYVRGKLSRGDSKVVEDFIAEFPEWDKMHQQVKGDIERELKR